MLGTGFTPMYVPENNGFRLEESRLEEYAAENNG